EAQEERPDHDRQYGRGGPEPVRERVRVPTGWAVPRLLQLSRRAEHLAVAGRRERRAREPEAVPQGGALPDPRLAARRGVVQRRLRGLTRAGTERAEGRSVVHTGDAECRPIEWDADSLQLLARDASHLPALRHLITHDE